MTKISSVAISRLQVRNLHLRHQKLNQRTGNTSKEISTSNGKKPFHAIPGPKPVPLFGNIWRYFPLIGDYRVDTLFENAQFNKRKYGLIVREQVTRNHTILHLFDPDDIESFFRQDGNEPFRRSHRALLKFRRGCPQRYNGGGLFAENGPEWSRMRNLFNRHLLNRSKISDRATILDKCILKFISSFDGANEESLHQETSIRIKNFEQLLQKWSLTSSLSILLDFSLDEMPTEPTLKALISSLHDELEAIDWTEIKSERWTEKPTRCPYYQKLVKSEDYLYTFVAGRLDDLIRSPSASPKGVSFVQDWLQVDKIDRKDVISFILDSMMASFHTTIYTTVFMLKHLSESGQTIRKQLKKEIRENLSPHSEGAVTEDMIKNMPFLRDCLRETLRLNPVSIGTGRLTQHDEIFIRGYTIPKDVMVIAQTQAICRDGNIFEQADQFKPERWGLYRRLPRSQRPSAFAWSPFGFGARSCLGKPLANLQICSLVARLLQRFSDIEFCDEVKTKTTLIHNIDGHVDVCFKK